MGPLEARQPDADDGEGAMRVRHDPSCETNDVAVQGENDNDVQEVPDSPRNRTARQVSIWTRKVSVVGRDTSRKRVAGFHV